MPLVADASPLRLALTGLGLSLVAQLGDLAESALKRLFGLKDASDLIPGHGGFMDRMDSIVAVAVAAGAVCARRRPARARAGPLARPVMVAQSQTMDGARASLATAPARHRLQGERKSLTILGATGSIGKSTLDLVARNPDAFEIVALTAQSNVADLAHAAKATGARLAVIGDVTRYGELKALLAGTGIKIAAGQAAIIAAAAEPADCVMAAIVGAAGIEPTFEAARQGRRLALANKECLVSAGEVFMAALAQAGTELIPVDSEHSAALAGSERGRSREHREDRADGVGRSVPHLGLRSASRAPRRRRPCATRTGPWARRSPSTPRR